jgi:hypothetical protein
MGVLDQVIQMRQRNMSDQDIISELRKQNISPRDINEALNHAQIKNAVSDIRGNEDMEVPTPQGEEQQYGDAYDQQAAPDQGYGYDQGQQPVYTPQPQQQAYYPQQQDYGNYYPPPPQTTTNTDTIVEVSEQVFDEKISDIAKRVDSIDEFKILTQARVEHLNERLKRIEDVIDKLQSAILEKIGSYGSNLESIKKEMSMMQDSFSKTISPRSQRSISSEGKESEEQPDNISKKKK